MPPRQPQQQPQYLDPDHEAIVTFASTYFDDEEERSAFVDTLMERRGYTRTSGWSLPSPQGGGGSGGGGQPAGSRSPYFRK